MARVYFENLKGLSHRALVEKLIEYAFKVKQCEITGDIIWGKNYKELLEQIKNELLLRLAIDK